MAAEQARNLSLDGLRQKRARAVAQNLGQRIGKSSWLRELENISVGHGVSLLCWRSGGLEHPHDTPPYPFTPSPTFAHSSASRGSHKTLVLPKSLKSIRRKRSVPRCRLQIAMAEIMRQRSRVVPIIRKLVSRR